METMDLASGAPASVDAEEIDPWGGEDDAEQSSSTQSLDLQREWDARRVQFHNLGYRDGITAGTNSSVQEGFNVGFKEAIVPGFSWGVARGASSLSAMAFAGCGSAYAALPSSLKEKLLKDQEARKRLETLHSTISSISSADAMGMYYKDSVLQKGVSVGDSVQRPAASDDSQGTVSKHEAEDTANACCGGGSCGSSAACSSHPGDGISTIVREIKPDASGSQPASSSAQVESTSKESVSKEAYEFILNVSKSSVDAKQLEDSTTNQLVSLALGEPGISTSTSTSSESSSRLGRYQRDVEAEFELSAVKLSGFPHPG